MSATMVGVLFHLIDVDDEDVGLFPIADHLLLILMLWDDLVHNFALDELLIVDQTSDRLSDRLPLDGQRWKRFRSLAEAEAAYPTARWVYFEHGGERLDAFEHPAGDVIYAFGPDSTGFVPQGGKTYVEIPAAHPYGFFSPVAAAIALYDRHTRLPQAGSSGPRGRAPEGQDQARFDSKPPRTSTS